MEIVRIENLTKSFKNQDVLKGINLNIDKGEVVSIIGPSGTGKSTLLRCINRLEEADSGIIYFEGNDIHDKNTDINELRTKIGMVFQSFNLFNNKNVLQNCTLALRHIKKIKKEEAEKIAIEELTEVGMQDFINAKVSTLSGGQKQRVAIARSLCMKPDILLFDEPTSALDPTMVDEVEAVIKDLVDDGMTCVIVTHEMRFAKNIADKVVFMAQKGIYEQGSTSEIFDNPKKPLTQKFLYRSRMFETTINKDELDLLSLSSSLKQFLDKYDTNKNQAKLVSYVCDELLYPVFNNDETTVQSCNLKLICSEYSDHHIIRISFPNLENDPLKQPYIDELNLKLLEHYSSLIISKKNENSYEVTIQM